MQVETLNELLSFDEPSSDIVASDDRRLGAKRQPRQSHKKQTSDDYRGRSEQEAASVTMDDGFYDMISETSVLVRGLPSWSH